MLKRKYGVMAGLLLGAIVILSGCTSTKLSSSFDKQTVEDTSKKVVNDINKGDYESIFNLFTKDMQAKLSADALKEAVQTALTSAGEFKDIKDVEVVGGKDKKSDTDMATAVLVAEYKNKNITYTISFNTEMKISGIYLK